MNSEQFTCMEVLPYTCTENRFDQNSHYNVFHSTHLWRYFHTRTQRIDMIRIHIIANYMSNVLELCYFKEVITYICTCTCRGNVDLCEPFYLDV